MGVELYRHNAETYCNAVKLFDRGIQRVGVVQPTGTGKSFIFLKWIEDNPHDRFIVLSPSVEIFAQFKEYAGETGDSNLLKNCELITYQTLLRKTPQEIEQLKADKIIVDEFHRTGADQWGQLVQQVLDTNPHSKVLGATATPVRYLDGGKNMAQELFDNCLARYMTLGEAVAQKILPMPTYVPVWYDMDGKMERYSTAIDNIADVERREKLKEKLKELRIRLQYSYGAEEVFKKYMPHNHGKYIVFCSDYEHLVAMTDKMKLWLEGINTNINIYISVSRDTKKDEQIQLFKNDNNPDSVKLLFTIDRLNEGVHIRGVDGVIMLRPTISPIIYLQQIGRALAAGSNRPVVFDMVNNYHNVQVSKGQSETENVFSLELALAFEEENIEQEDTTPYHLFEDMVEFNRLFRNLENILYTDNETRWQHTLELVKEYMLMSGKKPSAKIVYKDVNIGEWVAQQNRSYKRGDILPHREEQLKRAGIILGSQNDIKWYNSFELLKQYQKQYGHLPTDRTVYKEQNIGKWLCNQKNAFKQGKMTQKRKLLLQSAGVEFDGILDRRWELTFEILKQYIAAHNSLPSKEASLDGVNIGIWLANQIRLMRQGNMSPHRIQQLQSLGIDGEGSFDHRWNTNFEALKLYVQNGTQPDSSQSSDIVRWLKYQKTLFREGKLSSERQKKLQSAGIAFFKNSTDNAKNL